MNLPSKEQVHSVVYEVLLAVVLEEVVATLAGRLRYGRRCPECGAPSPKRRPLRRLGGAVLSELATEGGEELYWERQRLTAAVDRQIAASQAERRTAAHARIPQQRLAPREMPTQPSTDGRGSRAPVG